MELPGGPVAGGVGALLLLRHRALQPTRPAHPPRWCTRALLARGRWPELPHLEGVVGPVLRADGSVLQKPGYDRETSLLYAPTIELRPVPERPDGADVADALSLLREVVCDFPFKAEVHFSAWLRSISRPGCRRC